MTASVVLQGLPPVLSPATRLVILGSFPGVASLRAQQYYGHPQNQFWRLLAALLTDDATALVQAPYAERLRWLLAQGLGVWDVYASCQREGSLDSAIRAPVLNDLASLRVHCPHLAALAHNGGESYRHARHTRALGLPVYRLPSSSPAHASWSFERKLDAWREVLQHAGCLTRR